MRAVVQRVSEASVQLERMDEPLADIGTGLLILLGVGRNDDEEDAVYLARKVAQLRIFPDDDRHLNRSLVDVGGAALVIPNFTLYGDCNQGRRPSFHEAAPAEQGRRLYEEFVIALRDHVDPVKTGRFGAMMDVHLINDGPVTLLVDSEGSI